MYIPTPFNVTDRAELHAFIQSYSFALLVTEGKRGLTTTHLPILLDAERGACGVLLGHMARANQQWTDIHGDSLVIFPGPHAYISPNWYETPGTVPTWNYVAVHAYGVLQVTEDRDVLHDILSRSVSAYERVLPQPWTYNASDPDYEQMLKQIVGFHIEISRLEGKFKLNQNHPTERRRKVIRALESQPDSDSQKIARLMAAMLTD